MRTNQGMAHEPPSRITKWKKTNRNKKKKNHSPNFKDIWWTLVWGTHRITKVKLESILQSLLQATIDRIVFITIQLEKRWQSHQDLRKMSSWIALIKLNISFQEPTVSLWKAISNRNHTKTKRESLARLLVWMHSHRLGVLVRMRVTVISQANAQ